MIIQCETGLMCYHRSMHETEVPGCVGGDDDPTHGNYCVDSNALKQDPAVDEQLPSSSLTTPDIEDDQTEPDPDVFTTSSPTSTTSSPTPEPEVPRQIVNFGWDPTNTPLSKCQGHCSNDNDVS